MQLEVISQRPNKDAGLSPLLLVHGAWHGACRWEHFQSYFAKHGYGAYAVNLRGHGNSDGRDGIRWASAEEYVEDLEQAISTLPKPPMLIGHSAGGYLVQKYLGSRPAVAAVLLASISVNGAFKMFNRIAKRHPWKYLRFHCFFDRNNLIIYYCYR